MSWIMIGLGRTAQALSFAGVVGAAAGILLITGIILLEIILRTFFASSTFMSDEIVGYLIAAVGFLPLGYAFADGAILRVNLVLSWTEDRPRLRSAIEICCVVATVAVVGMLIWYLFGNVARQFTRGYTSGTMSGIPQWIPSGVMLAGLVIFWFQVVVYGLGVALGTKPIIVEKADETSIA